MQLNQDPQPLVSVGLPVYNGQRYLSCAIDSVLNQTVDDLELVISDNASTDDTQEICRHYAASDSRIRYYRQERNLGAAPNFNAVFHLSRGAYFRWQASDDVSLPTYLERCLEVLQSEGGAVSVAYPLWSVIDENGRIVADEGEDLTWRGRSPWQRVEDLLNDRPHSVLARCIPIYGLVPSDVMRRTGLFRPYASSDEVLILELALHGDLRLIPERLFLRRRHPNNYTTANKTQESRAAWFSSSYSGRYPMMRTRLALGHLNSVLCAPLGVPERLRCLRSLKRWFTQREWRVVAGELKAKMKEIYSLRRSGERQDAEREKRTGVT